MGIDLETIEKYIQQSVDEFDSNPLAPEFMQKMLDAEPDLFCEVAMKHLNSDERSNAHRFLAAILARRHDLLDRLTSPGFATRESAVTLFKRFYEVDPLFDIKLAQKLPQCGYGDRAGVLDSAHSARALDVLDQTSEGTRLLRILSPLTGSEDPRIAAKATLFIGRRLQNPAWTRSQLNRKDQRVRANAVEALWGANSLPAIRLLEQCTHDMNNRVVGNSLVGLYLAGSGEAREDAQQEVMTLSRSKSWELRSTAAWAMGRLATPAFKPRLAELVRDPQPLVRGAALRALMVVRRLEAEPAAP
jgi:hypothetical protein